MLLGIVWPIIGLRSKVLATYIVIPYGIYYYVMDFIAFKGHPSKLFEVKDMDQLNFSLIITFCSVTTLHLFSDFKLNVFI